MGVFFCLTEEMWETGDPGSNVVGQVRLDGEDRFDSLPDPEGVAEQVVLHGPWLNLFSSFCRVCCFFTYICIVKPLKISVMSFTKDQIKEKLASDPRWIERSLCVLFARQTEDEQRSDATVHNNGIGFSGCDSRYLSYCAKWLQKGSTYHLNDKHLEKCGKKLPKYWRQILDEIESKERQ